MQYIAEQTGITKSAVSQMTNYEWIKALTIDDALDELDDYAKKMMENHYTIMRRTQQTKQPQMYTDDMFKGE